MDCPDCEGEGDIARKACTVNGIRYPNAVVKCWKCDGTGEICSHCGESIAVCEGDCNDEEGTE